MVMTSFMVCCGKLDSVNEFKKKRSSRWRVQGFFMIGDWRSRSSRFFEEARLVGAAFDGSRFQLYGVSRADKLHARRLHGWSQVAQRYWLDHVRRG